LQNVGLRCEIRVKKQVVMWLPLFTIPAIGAPRTDLRLRGGRRFFGEGRRGDCEQHEKPGGHPGST
jgi:hypothetical protein